MREEELELYIRARHIGSIIKYLRMDDRKGLHVTDIVYGCPKYARYVLDSRESGTEYKNISEDGLIRITAGKLFDSISFGDWHHVDLKMRIDGMYELYGQIDDILYLDGKLIVVDKKTVVTSPPKEAHSHYVNQVRYYVSMLYFGEILGSEIGDTEALRRLLEKIDEIYGAILYIDIGVTTKTRISEAKVIGKWKMEEAEEIYYEVAEIVRKVMDGRGKEIKMSWFCQYCPIMNSCYSEFLGEI